MGGELCFMGRKGRSVAWTNQFSSSDKAYKISSHSRTPIDWLGLPRVLCGWMQRLHHSLLSKACDDLLTVSATGAGRIIWNTCQLFVFAIPDHCFPPKAPSFWRFHSDLTI